MHSVNSPISDDLQTAGDAVAQKAKSEDGGTRQEVRFAVAMSGGVSLAVWMGGVAREMNLLQQASNLRKSPGEPPDSSWDDKCRNLYLHLLDLLDVTVTTDVLSGTSAGGINAALLGLASVTGIDLGGCAIYGSKPDRWTCSCATQGNGTRRR